MCGIVGYIGMARGGPFLVEGLRRLEYRGYDSAGAAFLVGGRVVINKALGRVSDLAQAMLGGAGAHTGIGHTRWATHGRPSDRNAHPHPDCEGRIAVVHNGDRGELSRAEGRARRGRSPLRIRDRHRGPRPPGRVAAAGRRTSPRGAPRARPGGGNPSRWRCCRPTIRTSSSRPATALPSSWGRARASGSSPPISRRCCPSRATSSILDDGEIAVLARGGAEIMRARATGSGPPAVPPASTGTSPRLRRTASRTSC